MHIFRTEGQRGHKHVQRHKDRLYRRHGDRHGVGKDKVAHYMRQTTHDGASGQRRGHSDTLLGYRKNRHRYGAGVGKGR